MKASGLNIRSVWGDIERWWNNWTRYYAVRAGKEAYSPAICFASAYLNNFYYTCMMQLKRSFPKVGVYTGRSFVVGYAKLMAGWLASFDLWVAQYMYQPSVATIMSWDTLKNAWLPKYDPNIADMGITPDNLVGHQFTGDVALLPGSYSVYPTKRTALDVSIFKNAYLAQFNVSDAGKSPVVTPDPISAPIVVSAPAPVIPLFKAKVMSGAANVRNAPGGAILRSVPQNTVLSIYGVSGDWGRIDHDAEQWVFMSNLQRLP